MSNPHRHSVTGYHSLTDCLNLCNQKLYMQLTSLNHRWTVHRGEGSDPTELMFTVQRSHPLQWRARLDVFFLSNQVRNFSVVKEKPTFGGYFKAKQDFVVTINPGVDYAFVVSLLVILSETNSIF
ncbi:hypothetical protein ARALYDRAFT_908631 [Arabidopsis lyrata subsp. lyrata]|uniref:Tubby C-terminal domain-containing protein n=1 Tax=Arabidopsis lyrata subsp. lyrata TaxID=81972 RepID=D7LZW0_ARALL|nr:hypothetical protein ARALYDRAFT_908631 [Arabidopsis lyrata subsp. lyrata]